MEGYKDFFYATSIIVAIWIVALASNPKINSLLDLIMLALAAIYLIVIGIKEHKKGKRFMALSFIITALMPFLFYAQMYLISILSTDIDAKIFLANKMHAYVIYNIFRFIALALSFMCALIVFIKAVKNFASHV